MKKIGHYLLDLFFSMTHKINDQFRGIKFTPGQLATIDKILDPFVPLESPTTTTLVLHDERDISNEKLTCVNKKTNEEKVFLLSWKDFFVRMKNAM